MRLSSTILIPLCSVLHLRDSNAGFCGSNLGMGLPVPCRKPQEGSDYGLLGSHTQFQPEARNQANKGVWKCKARAATANGLRQKKPRIAKRKFAAAVRSVPGSTSKSYSKNLTAESRIDFQIEPVSLSLQKQTVSDSFSITVYRPVAISTNLCPGQGRSTACYRACCDSL